MTRVLVLATSKKTRGGITSVLKALETGEQWRKFHCHWIQTHRDGPNWRKLLYLVAAWIDYLIRLPFYDIIHIHFSSATTARRKKQFIRVAKCLNKRIIIHLHFGSKLNTIWNEDYDYLFSKADVALLLSDNLRKIVAGHTGEKVDLRVCYNPCPVITEEPKYSKTQSILFSGTLNKYKGYQDLIKAFAKIADSFPNWKLVLAGNGEIEEAKQLALQYGLTNQIQLLGWVQDKEKDKVYKEASILCLPSYAEGFPMAVLDAWAYGLPVVTTPVGGIPDIAKDGINMLLFNPGDVNKLSVCLETLIRDKGLRDRLSKESILLSKTIFNLNTITKQIGDIYEELSNN